MNELTTALDRLESFLTTWPSGTHVTTRGLQSRAGLTCLEETQRAAEILHARGRLDVQRVGATSLWSIPQPGS
jgi:hypothetical protein